MDAAAAQDVLDSASLSGRHQRLGGDGPADSYELAVVAREQRARTAPPPTALHDLRAFPQRKFGHTGAAAGSPPWNPGRVSRVSSRRRF
jgi:hypothetical protein